MPNDPHARFTVGRIAAEPGSVNAIPSSVIFYVDIRHPELHRLYAIEAHIVDTLRRSAGKSGCTVAIDRIFDMEPARFAEPLVACIEQTAAACGVRSRRIVSGAFHDALFVSRVAPAAMIFVPCRDGVSHNAREFVEPEFCVTGAEILLHATLGAMEQAARADRKRTDTANT